MIYLDHNASAPLRPGVVQVMQTMFDLFGNPSSTHQAGRKIRESLNKARQVLGDYFTVPTAQVIFTSGATEANNLALKGFNGAVVTNYGEHESVFQSRSEALQCALTSDGHIDLTSLQDVLKNLRSTTNKPILISLMAANNETGVLQPLKEAITIARQYDAFIHCDGVQIMGKNREWLHLDLDMITISAHKIGGPTGTGALILKKDITLMPLLVGGGQERFYRAGTENTLGISGFAQAITECNQDDWEKIQLLRAHLESTLKSISTDSIIIGQKAARLPNTLCLTMPGVKNSTQLMAFDMAGIMVSTGSACSSGKVQTSRVLTHMGLSPKEADEAIRISLGWYTTSQDIETFINKWADIFKRTKNENS